MKQILALVLFLGLAAPAFAQPAQQVIPTPAIDRTFNLTATSQVGPASSPWITEQGMGLVSHTITWTTTGTVSTCSVKVEKSADGITWADMIAGATCTSASSTGTITTDIANFVRVNATTLTGSGTLRVVYNAFKIQPALSATISATGLATSAAQTDGSQKVQVVNTGGTNLAGAGATLPVSGVKTTNAAVPGATNIGVLPCLVNTSAPTVTDTFQAALSCDVTGGLRLASAYAIADPCDGTAKTPKVFSISSATTTVLVSASASNKVYICSLNVVVSTANNVALVEDATGSCASPDAGMAGGVTAATGWNFAANGGMTFGNGGSSVFQTASTNVNVCFITSGTSQTSGSIQYVLAP